MIAVAIAMVAIGVLLLFLFPWGGIVLGLVGVPEDTAETPPPPGAQPAAVRRPLPHPGQLRRERRTLIQAREDRIRDLGGLMLEMYRRDQFRQDLVVDRCEELVLLE